MVLCRIRGRSESFLVCKECDTVWEDVDPTSSPPFVILEEYAARFDVSPLWSNLERLEGDSEK